MQLNSFPSILADAAPAAGQPQNPVMAFLPMILLVVVFYFILIRPQQKRAKELRKLLETLKSGDEVVTAAGIVGTVITVKDKTVTLRSGDAKFEVTKSSVSEIIADPNATVVKA
ncbi:MAG TPA: preprotein translocase subunit YajC [Verrucomicrobiae bacterium]